MAYKMKKFSGFKSPTKETQGFSGDQALIASQKDLAATEMAYKAPGWARVASSILPGHDPTAGAGKGGGSKSAGGAGGVREGIQEVRGAYKEGQKLMKDFKGTKQPEMESDPSTHESADPKVEVPVSGN